MSARGITLPKITFQSFEPTADLAAGKKKGATDEAARPIGENMISATTERPSAPQISALNNTSGGGDGINRSRTHAEQWYSAQIARGHKEVFSEHVSVTPQMAALLLKKNPDNRNVSKRRIAEIRADLEAGRYVLNGEPIIVSKDGLLNDGQHRLLAAVEANVTFRSMIVFGVSRSSRTTLDQGAARTVADYLDMQGDNEYSKVVATVGRMLWQYQKHGAIFNGCKGKGRSWPTKAETLGVISDNERDILRSVQAVQQTSKLVGSFSFVVFCRVILERADRAMGPVFIERLLDGASLKTDSPIFLLRERFINEPRMRQPDRFEAVVRAWNAMRKGRPLSKIMIMGSVPKVEG